MDEAPSMADASELRFSLQTQLVDAFDGPLGATLRDAAGSFIRDHLARGRRGLAICAPSYGAGVSMITAAFAIALAEAGVRVLVVDANLRQPMMQQLLPPPAPRDKGLLQFLAGEGTVSEVVEAEVLHNVSVIYSGGTGPGVQELFDGERFGDVMRYALRSFEITLVDTPPANRCAEARRIAAITGYAAVVGRRDVTMAEDLTTLVKDLRLNRVEVIGSIFNEG